MLLNEIRARRRIRRALAFGGLAIALVLTACGGSTSPAAPADATSEGVSPAKAAVTSAADGLATATANVAKYSAAPTGLGVAQPLPAAPEKGKTVVFLQCEVQQCNDAAGGFRAAATAVGWQVQTLLWKTTDPATLVAALQQALTLNPKPYAVIFSGLAQPIWAAQEAAYAKAGVLMVTYSIGDVTLSKTVIGNVFNTADKKLQGKLLADWFIKDSNGKGKVLQQDIPQYPSIAAVGQGFRDEVASACPGCAVTTLDVTGGQVASNGVTPAIISALQRDPSIGYIASSNIALAQGLPAAMKAANLSDVKILGGAPTAVDEQNVRNGAVAAVMKNDLPMAGWMMIDILVRHAAGLDVAGNDGGVPEHLLTKDTIGPAAQATLDYPTLFKKMWQVS